MFYKSVNTNNREEMIAFLSNHFRYNTMNTWNRMTSYANNVKLNRLNIPKNLIDKAYDFLFAECEEYQFAISDLISEFCHETGYTAGFNGRNDGYIVLYNTELDRNGKRITILAGIDDYTDFEEWETNELRDRVSLVQRFDKLCDEIRNTFLYYVEQSEITDIEVIRKETKRVAIMKEV